jgi:N utilization substance protein B
MVRELFAESFTHQKYLDKNAGKILKLLPDIDKVIKKSATAWPIDKINRIDLAILRFAVFEMMEKSTPKKVIIDEAVEIAKEYGSENSPSFINGVLGTIYEEKA